MGKASSVVWTFAAAMLKAIATDTNPTERRSGCKNPEAQATTQVGKLLPSSTNGVSLSN
jgi:hypothetical protein